jgi:hypothetical protein
LNAFEPERLRPHTANTEQSPAGESGEQSKKQAAAKSDQRSTKMIEPRFHPGLQELNWALTAHNAASLDATLFQRYLSSFFYGSRTGLTRNTIIWGFYRILPPSNTGELLSRLLAGLFK